MKVMVTGGAGFIGCCAVERFLRRGDRVTVVDNLSRRGSDHNLSWLKGIGPVDYAAADMRDVHALKKIFSDGSYDAVLHLAAQVAVTSSVRHPRHDFECNALGTFNLLEAVRLSGQEPLILYSSTNKVYGELEGVESREGKTRYTLSQGVTERQFLDFHSPYGCSKGSADQYVRDYARIYGMKTVVFRQSCIYGPRQFGLEDQGWVAWFAIALLLGRPLTVYGNGKQVRDILYIDDLLDCFDRAIERADVLKGEIFNIGGGQECSISLLEFLALLEELTGKKTEVAFANWRPGDQKAYISDISRARTLLGWEPRVTPRQGLEKVIAWIEENRDSITDVLDEEKHIHM